MIRLAVVDDEHLFRSGIISLLNHHKEFEVLYSASNGEELLTQIENKKIIPDICILDLNMKPMDGIDTTKNLYKISEYIKIIILSSHYSLVFVKHMINLGINAFLPKILSPDELYRAIKIVDAKGLYLTELHIEALKSNSVKIRPNFEKNENLTVRETEVLYYICHGLSNKEISNKIHRSVRTIEGHRNNLILKTGVKNTVSLVIYAIYNHLIEIDENIIKRSFTNT